MARKTWIKVKRGLSEDPKHRDAMGNALWCFLHMIDRADWETGIVHDWRDDEEAIAMGVSPYTLRDWRQKLEKENYISCQQIQHGQDITIFKWVNPREYSGKVYNNTPTGGQPQNFDDNENPLPLENQGDTHGDTQGDTQVRGESITPTLDSESESLIKAANKEVDYILETAKKFTYLNREKIPEPLLPLADTYFDLTGQEPRKAVLHEWIMELNEWQQAGVHPDHLRDAFAIASRPERGWPVLSPRSLTKQAIAIKSKPKAARPETKLFQPKEIKDTTPMPASVKEKLDKLMKKVEVK